MRGLLMVMGCVGLLALPGCAGFSFLGYLFGAGERVKAVYTLEDRTTAILVDDPLNALSAPALPGVIANNLRYHLEQEEVFETAAIVPQDRVKELAEQLGEDYAITPIDQVGRELGAEQVIHVEVESATLYHHSSQVIRPTCVVRVKVIDVVNRRRLFPGANVLKEDSYTPPGQRVEVKMTYKGMDVGGRGMEALLAQQLAETTGKKVSQLFYDHDKPPPGQMIK